MAEEALTIPSDVLKKANIALDKAKLQLISIKRSTFTTTLLFSLKIKWDISIPTMCVDGVSLTLNPNFFLSLKDPEKVFGLAHEAWHIAFEHITRFSDLGEQADFKTYNEAADHVINNMLKEKGYAVPSFAVCNPNYKNMTTEQVYRDLIQKKSQNPDFIPDFAPANSDNSSPDTPENKSGMSEKDLKSKIDEMLVKANTASRMNPDADGSVEDVPDSISNRIEEIINPKVDWRTLLRNYMFEIVRDDFSYKRPNKRYMCNTPAVIIPSLYSEGMGDLAIGIDISGSVSDKQFNAFKAEINQIKDTLNPENTEIIQWHHAISKIDKLDRYQDMSSVDFQETGGTNVYPLLERWIETPPTVGIIFTDGYFRNFDKPELINFPLIWVIYDNDSYTTDCGSVVTYDPDID